MLMSFELIVMFGEKRFTIFILLTFFGISIHGQSLWDILTNKDDVGTTLTRKTLQNVIGVGENLVGNLTSIQEKSSDIFSTLESFKNLLIPNSKTSDVSQNSGHEGDNVLDLLTNDKTIQNMFLQPTNMDNVIKSFFGINPTKPKVEEIQDSPSLTESLASFSLCDKYKLQCQYLQCLADNFGGSQISKNLQMADTVIFDSSLRRMLMDNPELLNIACQSSKLNNLECLTFKGFLGFVDILDPAKAHVDDEPREKRSLKIVDEVFSLLLSNGTSNDNETKSDYNYESFGFSTDSNSSAIETSIRQMKNCSLLLTSQNIKSN